MNLNGRKANVNVVTEIFIREGQEPLVFKASAILDGEDFVKYVPEPVPPTIQKPGEEVGTPDYSDPKYLKACQNKADLQSYFMIIKSLAATPGLAWDKVKLEDPKTWKFVDEELKDFGLSSVEKNKLVKAVMRANSLDSEFIEEAKKRFILSQQAVKVALTSSL